MRMTVCLWHTPQQPCRGSRWGGDRPTVPRHARGSSRVEGWPLQPGLGGAETRHTPTAHRRITLSSAAEELWVGQVSITSSRLVTPELLIPKAEAPSSLPPLLVSRTMWVLPAAIAATGAWPTPGPAMGTGSCCLPGFWREKPSLQGPAPFQPTRIENYFLTLHLEAILRVRTSLAWQGAFETLWIT
jgi:hypothetical protein